MSDQGDIESFWIEKLENICSELNVDKAATNKSKESFLAVKRNYTLDGEPLHWVACALYVACRSSITPTIQSGTAVEGNCVSLTRLLRLCNISLIQFFNKIKNWMDMTSMSIDFKERIERLESKFAVSTVLFRKFQPLFQELFVGLTNDTIKPNSRMSKKQKILPCTTNALYEFTWCLYISVKGEFHKSAHDLVDMYHLLLACLDFVFGNVYMAHRTDLINPTFKGLPSNWDRDDVELPSKPICIISALCEMKDGLPIEAATMKEYTWKPVIKTFFDKGILKGNKSKQLGVLDVGNFDVNLKSVNNIYETYVLSVGEFDERIFFGEHASNQVGSPNKSAGDEFSKVIANFGAGGRPTCPDTPLTGRRYLSGLRSPLTPVSEATNSLARLRAYLSGAKPKPNTALLRLFAECGVLEETIDTKVVKPCAKWSAQLLASLKEANTSNENITYRCNMITCLYYKVFEHILREEHRKKPQVSLEVLVSQELYQLAMFACCAEVVLHAYGTHSLRFPRVLHVLQLSAFHFYKIIELVVQALVEKMSRDIIKHLNAIEEEVLESLVWSSGSPLWSHLGTPPQVPPAADVAGHESPRRTQGTSAASSTLGRLLTSNPDQAKKQLFNDNIKPGQSLLVKQDPESPGPSTSQPAAGGSTDTAVSTARRNSLILFFRKFYSLSVVRLNDLCSRLRLPEEPLRRKVWTCLEHCVLRHTELLRDRHLDQILMCAVYVICKVSHSEAMPVERTFAEIMRCYRQRPLADNHVYRSVLIDTPDGGTPERGDLIKFYNKVFVQHMQTFALSFSGRNKDSAPLSPLPVSRGGGYSPLHTRVSERHQLYVKPLTAAPPAHHLTYRFSRSPAKDLHAINSMLCSVAASVKRPAEGEGGEDPLVKRNRFPAPGVARKLQGLMSDRQTAA